MSEEPADDHQVALIEAKLRILAEVPAHAPPVDAVEAALRICEEMRLPRSDVERLIEVCVRRDIGPRRRSGGV